MIQTHEIRLFKCTGNPTNDDWIYLEVQARLDKCIARCEFPEYIPGTKTHITIDVFPGNTVKQLTKKYNSYFKDIAK